MKDENVGLLARFQNLFAKRAPQDPEAEWKKNEGYGKPVFGKPAAAEGQNMGFVLDPSDDRLKMTYSPKVQAKGLSSPSSAMVVDTSGSTHSGRLMNMLRMGNVESESSTSVSNAKQDPTSGVPYPRHAQRDLPHKAHRGGPVPANVKKMNSPAAKHKQKPEDDLNSIKQLGLYDIGQTIGSGTFSKVKMGYNRVTGEKVAVKIITKNENHKGFNTKRIFQEINVQKAAVHPRICQILNVFDTGSHVCIMLEYAPTDLLQYINSTRLKYLSDDESRNLFAQIMDGVAYLHNNGIIHRDLKPQNVLLDVNMNVKIADFGFGKMQDEDIMSTVCGSSVYAAPELVRYKKDYAGKPADIWACGIILYNMLLGKMPFKRLSQTLKTSARHILYDPHISEADLMNGLEIPATITREARELLRSLISIDVSRRLTAEQIRSHTWMKGHVGAAKEKLAGDQEYDSFRV